MQHPHGKRGENIVIYHIHHLQHPTSYASIESRTETGEIILLRGSRAFTLNSALLLLTYQMLWATEYRSPRYERPHVKRWQKVHLQFNLNYFLIRSRNFVFRCAVLWKRTWTCQYRKKRTTAIHDTDTNTAVVFRRFPFEMHQPEVISMFASAYRKWK